MRTDYNEYLFIVYDAVVTVDCESFDNLLSALYKLKVCNDLSEFDGNPIQSGDWLIEMSAEDRMKGKDCLTISCNYGYGLFDYARFREKAVRNLYHMFKAQ